MKTKSLLHYTALGLAVATMMCLTVQSSKAQIWDANADFSTTVGQNVLVNGVWSYGTYNTTTALYANIPSANYDPNGWSNPGLNTWYTVPNGTGLPAIFKNNGAGPMANLPVGKMALHPDELTFAINHAVLLWTAPAAGDYQFALDWNYYGGGGGGAGVLTSLTRNLSGSGGTGTPNVSLGTWTLTAGAPTASLLQTYTLAIGETMAFAVNPNGGAGADTTGIEVIVTAVPEPSTFALLTGALVCGAVFVRSRRQRASH